tara:strand:+ start:292 stop:1413 length:1122 start_codon:yes stop_codon:yes gene_type:complete
MLQNKIFHNFIIEIFKSFLIILFGLSMIALTVRAVNFLDLIVDSGYSVSTYFKYSLLNLLGISVKFIPLSFLISLSIFVLKHLNDNEFIILWTSGVKKISLVKIFVFISCLTAFTYLIFSTFLTPLSLNKSRGILNDNTFNSFLPTVKAQRFSDSFKGFTFFVEKKVNNQIKNVFIHDTGNNLKNLSPNVNQTNDTTILAESGIIDNKKLLLINGQIISTKKNVKNEIIDFEQLIVSLDSLDTTTIKKPKIQETSTIELLKCLMKQNVNTKLCNDDYKKEIIATLNRRVVIPFYIPIIALICAMPLIKTKKIYLNKFFCFFYSFFLLVFTEIAVRYTGLSNLILFTFILIPIFLYILIYFFLSYKFSRELKYE